MAGRSSGAAAAAGGAAGFAADVGGTSGGPRQLCGHYVASHSSHYTTLCSNANPCSLAVSTCDAVTTAVTPNVTYIVSTSAFTEGFLQSASATKLLIPPHILPH